MSMACFKRLRMEIKSMSDDPDIFLESSESDIRRWKAHIRGPPGTPYEGGVFELDLTVGMQYPLVPPAVTFVTRVFHPNVHFTTGAICLDVLSRAWTPAWGLQATCRALLALLSDPAADSPLNCDAGNMIRAGDACAFESMARMYTLEHAARDMPRRAGS
ncbi:ubiquitin-conjugating enzyme/RWD-like protein [Tribonema minus]|uniref:Ubiquitin-conjugating enzyme/RWD-like protein n=1 Tax=Tribonema minus TaxID=303371 RepID=A0A835Z5T9_9STRA|nr:ubiquitin-conjugating enzyme/RWD-like protein [Tribonema minus]